MNRTLAALGATTVIAAALTGCSNQPDAYAPASYGANGLCPVNWVASPAPVWYRARYAGYFDSPAYYDHYVPVSVRKVYVTHVTTWNNANASTVKAQRVNVGSSNSRSYSSGNSRGDRAGGASYGSRSSSSSSRVSVGSSSGRSYSSGSRR